nr:MAG TPA: hypothetical protein [Caudoviricetes sp.]
MATSFCARYLSSLLLKLAFLIRRNERLSLNGLFLFLFARKLHAL